MSNILKKWWPHIVATATLLYGIISPAVITALFTWATTHPKTALGAVLLALLGMFHLPSPSQSKAL